MAKLGDFLGGILSGISDARVNSDIQSVKIADEYSKNDLLKHFAVPRMRFDKVEVNVPVAISELIEKSQKIYEPIDNKSFSSKAYQQILKSLLVSSLPNEVSKTLKTTIAEHIHLAEAKIRVNQIENVLEDFSKNIALKIVDLADLIFQGSERKKLNRDELILLQNTITKGLQESLKDEIKLNSENKVLESLEVIVEAHKLHDIKPENIIMIKMTVSEHGMEWVDMENINGDIVTKLMPE
jgi:hypothetical protein